MNYQKKTAKILKTTKFGRAKQNDLIVNEESVSRYHGQIFERDGQFYLKDTGSRFGTFYRIKNRAQISEGVTFCLGTSQLEVSELVIKRDKTSSFSIKLKGSLYKTLSFNNKTSIDIGNETGKKDFALNDD